MKESPKDHKTKDLIKYPTNLAKNNRANMEGCHFIPFHLLGISISGAEGEGSIQFPWKSHTQVTQFTCKRGFMHLDKPEFPIK